MILLIFAPLEASLNEPITIVKNIFNLAKDKKIRLNKDHQSKIEKMFNFKIMGQEILGKDFLKYGKKEFTWFHKTIKKIITKTIYPKAPNFLNEVKIEFINIEKSLSFATVFSIVKSKGEETEVNYRLKLIENSWKVINITIDDESWVENIAERVKKTIKKKKWEGLKNLLTKRLNEIK
jgi:ABC-type transporter MlaC component